MRLIINIEGQHPKTVDIEELEFSLGRSSKVAIKILAEGVSRFHFDLISKDGVIYIKDLGSINGTFVNGQRLQPLKQMAWQTFFPITIGSNVSISFVEIIAPEKVIYDVPKVPQKSVKKTEKVIKKKEIQKSKSQLMPFILVFGLGCFLYYYYKNKSETVVSEITKKEAKKTKNISKGLIEKVVAQANQPKCKSELEKNVCIFLGAKLPQEGIVQDKQEIIIYFDFMTRIKNVEIEPSFNMADDKLRITYLMSYMAFNEKIKELVKKSGAKNLKIVDINPTPFKANHVLTVDTKDLFKLNVIDLDILFTKLNKGDTDLFNALMKPMIGQEDAI